MIKCRHNYKDSNFFDITLVKDDVKVSIFYGGNCDLVIQSDGNGPRIMKDNFDGEMTYIVTKDDEEYDCFNTLVDHILRNRKEDRHGLIDDNNVINWYSNDSYLEAANMLSIRRENEDIVLTFYHNKYNDLDFGVPVVITNSGCRYYTFNIYFMELYKNLQSYANRDINIFGLNKKSS